MLQQIRSNDGISRTDIAKILGLKKSSVTKIVQELIDYGVVRVLKQGDSRPQGGRKPILLEITAESCSVLGVEIQPSYYRAVLLNFKGDIIFQKEDTFPDEFSDLSFSEVADNVFNLVKDDIEKTGMPLVGISFGIPGYVDTDSGVILRSDPHGLENFRFSEEKRKLYNIPVLVENDANCGAWAELNRKKGEVYTDFMFMLAEIQKENKRVGHKGGMSLGFGLVIDGKVYAGNGKSAGDFKSAFWRSGNRSQVGISDDEMRTIDSDDDVLEKYIEEILVNLSVLTSVFNPSKIIIGGDTEKYSKMIDKILQSRLKDRYIGLKWGEGLFRTSSFGEMAVAVGAAGMLLEKYYRGAGLSEEDNNSSLDLEFVFSVTGRRAIGIG